MLNYYESHCTHYGKKGKKTKQKQSKQLYFKNTLSLDLNKQLMAPDMYTMTSNVIFSWV
jgi:hypothetical protein